VIDLVIGLLGGRNTSYRICTAQNQKAKRSLHGPATPIERGTAHHALSSLPDPSGPLAVSGVEGVFKLQTGEPLAQVTFSGIIATMRQPVPFSCAAPTPMSSPASASRSRTGKARGRPADTATSALYQLSGHRSDFMNDVDGVTTASQARAVLEANGAPFWNKSAPTNAVMQSRCPREGRANPIARPRDRARTAKTSQYCESFGGGANYLSIKIAFVRLHLEPRDLAASVVNLRSRPSSWNERDRWPHRAGGDRCTNASDQRPAAGNRLAGAA
jgi:hypothetical protein